MKLLSPLRSVFSKAANSRPFQVFHKHAGKIAAVSYLAADGLLSSTSFLDGEPQEIDFTNLTPEQLQSAAGVFFLAANLTLFAADRYPGAKKPIGVLICAGAACMAASADSDASQWKLAVSAGSIFATGIALTFENAARRASQRIKDRYENGVKPAFAKAVETVLNYPVAAGVLTQFAGVGTIIAEGISNPASRHLAVYGALWLLGNAAVSLTDDGIKELVRGGDTPRVPHQN